MPRGVPKEAVGVNEEAKPKNGRRKPKNGRRRKGKRSNAGPGPGGINVILAPLRRLRARAQAKVERLDRHIIAIEALVQER